MWLVGPRLASQDARLSFIWRLFAPRKWTSSYTTEQYEFGQVVRRILEIPDVHYDHMVTNVLMVSVPSLMMIISIVACDGVYLKHIYVNTSLFSIHRCYTRSWIYCFHPYRHLFGHNICHVGLFALRPSHDDIVIDTYLGQYVLDVMNDRSCQVTYSGDCQDQLHHTWSNDCSFKSYS